MWMRRFCKLVRLARELVLHEAGLRVLTELQSDQLCWMSLARDAACTAGLVEVAALGQIAGLENWPIEHVLDQDATLLRALSQRRIRNHWS